MFYEERKRYQHGKCGPHFNGIHINLQIDAGTNRNECKRERLHWTHTNSAPRGMCLHKNQARLWFSFSLLWLLWWTLLAAAHTRTHNLLTRSRTPLLNQRSNTVLSLHMSVYTPMLLSYCQRGWLLNMELTITLYSVLTISVVSSSTIYPGWDSHHIMSKIFGLTTCLNQSTAKLTAGGKFSSRFWIWNLKNIKCVMIYNRGTGTHPLFISRHMALSWRVGVPLRKNLGLKNKSGIMWL